MGNKFPGVGSVSPAARGGASWGQAIRERLNFIDWDFINGSIVLSVGVAVARVLGLAFSLVLARALTPGDYGFIQYSITLAGVIAIGTQPFTQHVLARYIGAYSQQREKLHGILNNAWIILLVLFAATLLIVVPIMVAMNRFNLGALVIFGGITLFYTYYGLARGLLANLKLLAAYLGSNLVQLIAVIFVIHVLHDRSSLPALMIYGLSYVLPIILLGIFFPLPLTFQLRVPKREVVIDILKFSAPIWISHTCYIFYTGLDILLLERYRGPQEVGVYALSKTLSAVFGFVPLGITTILMPKVAKSQGVNHWRLLRNALLWYMGTNIILIVIYAVTYNWFVSRTFGPKYETGPQVFVVSALATIVLGTNSIIASVMVGRNRPKVETISVMIGLIGGLVVGWLTIPRYGQAAAAATMLIGASIALMTYGIIGMMWRVRRNVTPAETRKEVD